MERMKMHSRDNVARNVEEVGRLFPNALTEVMRDGKLVQAIDFDVLRQELAREIVEGREERYAFTWPDKRQAILAANAPIAMTLRPIVEDSVGRDGTEGAFDSENLYIEGDNLDVLKLLQETYLGKVKMIYIDPPYNTGNDAFVYDDDFAMADGDFHAANGWRDEDGAMQYDLRANNVSNGRFHTDWLNMIYPRLKVAKSLLADDGVIFISIDDNEVHNLRKVCDEIFGEGNFVAIFPWRKRTAKSDVPFGISQDYEQILCYAKSSVFVASTEGSTRRYYETEDFPNKPWRIHDLTTQRTASERPNSFFDIVNPKTGEAYPANSNAVWRVTKESCLQYMEEDRIVFPGDYDFLRITKPVLRYWKEDDIKKDGEHFGRKPLSTHFPKDVGMSQNGTKELTDLLGTRAFSFPKPKELIRYLIQSAVKKDDLILDFFSGSATSAHAVMQLNAEDGGSRKFIMVQLTEVTDEKSEAYRAGYRNICEIGKERIRRAGAKIAAEAGEKAAGLDRGFRCLRLDTSNMTDVYYVPDAVTQDGLFAQVDNVKADRTPEDLLFQTMLDLGILLSAPITVEEISGKRVFNVADGFLLACFDRDVTDETVMAIAKRKPYYAVFRDASMADDSALTNFDQLFAAYSPATVRWVL